MQLVSDRSGTPYRLVKHSGESVLVEGLDDGERQFLQADDVRRLVATRSDSSAGSIPEGVPGPRALELLRSLAAHGTTDVRVLLERTDYCESDLFAVLRVLERADLVEQERSSEGTSWTLTAIGRDRLASVDHG